MIRRPLGAEERRDWLRLARTQNVGPVTFAQLIARFGSAGAALQELPRLSRRGGGEAVVPFSTAEAQKELDVLAQFGARLIASIEPEFPHGLAALDPPPPLIALAGHAALVRREMVAVVGARNASALGRRFAAQLARDLGSAGFVVVSGLARGIDAAAHEASLPSGTCAVIAGGIDVIYPPENTQLYARIRAEGALICEMPFGERPQARHFPRRNRLISGLGRGVVVVEAAENSGSLITARFALEQNREVFAVPGSPLDPRAKGTNRLIREGAVLVESAEDVISVLKPMLGGEFREVGPDREPSLPDRPVLEAEADRIRGSIEEALGPAPVDVDELIRLCKAPAAAVLTVLLEMELAGRVARHSGNRVSWA
ncbi:MAG: DNA-protecting protein DprA [Alphaproteobacteria bacterium]|nr:DNA-protecting protein DprA [Alphaproteobacteria bacterium]MBV9694014.1 DNA-protecting protein DprA [Alphaproteobacteria bacterium]